MKKIKVLVIDDIESWRSEVVRVLKHRKDIDCEIDEASSIDDGNKALDNDLFDVVVIDMHISEETEGGLVLIESLRRWNPSAVPIVFTAYPSLQNCVRAMQHGAWDYIDKNDTLHEYKNEKGKQIPAVQVLLGSIIEGLDHRFSPEAGPNSLWLQDHLPDLSRQYGGKIVAFIEEKVVAAEDSVELLKGKIRETYLGQTKEPYFMRIPRDYKGL